MNKHLPRILIVVIPILILLLLAGFLFSDGGEDSPALNDEEGYLFLHTPYETEVCRDFGEIMESVMTCPVADRFRIYPDIAVNGVAVSRDAEVTVVGDVIYVAALPVIHALLPTVEVSHPRTGTTELREDGFTCQIIVGEPYFLVNEQYYYVPSNVQQGKNGPLLPLWTLADSLGCSVRQDAVTNHISLRHICPLAQGITYNEEDLHWLSHIIYAESGNQPMAGRIAVGTVIMNRLNDEYFPDTIKEIVFQEGQFSPVGNGTIYLEPDEWSIIAAKLCLTGTKVAGDSLYFNVSSLRSWAYYNRPYICTIGDHSFFL